MTATTTRLKHFKANVWVIVVGHSNARNYIAMTRKELHKNLVRYYSKITNCISTAPNTGEYTHENIQCHYNYIINNLFSALM